MKLTVAKWTALQGALPVNEDMQAPTNEADLLWDLIEERTFGKRHQTEVGIRLDKRQQELADAALAHVDSGAKGRMDGSAKPWADATDPAG